VKVDAKIRDKIKTPAEVAAAIGPRPRARKVILCHGTFDIVHPGHIRHLLYAKSKADILVVSLTGDAHIAKAAFRPFVPEDLRAMNLAAFEMVDYVVVDPEAKPLTNLQIIQPDYFAKGYEYGGDGKIDPRTQEEIDVLAGFGGEIIFTPGDVVFSSSAIIEGAPPKIAIEKLLSLLEAEGLSLDAVRSALDGFAGVTVHVVGDTIVDGHTHTTLIGGNTKTPTFSVRFERQKDYVGGAGIVAKHLKAAGADVVFTTVLGDDRLKDFVLKDLAEAGVRVNAVVDRTRPTTHKNAFIAGGYRLLKVDTLDNRAISGRIFSQVRDHVAGEKAGVVVFSDFRHGIFNRSTIPAMIGAIPKGAFRVADSQVATRWGNILDFKGFDLITPNEREARFSLGDQDSVVRPLALKLYEQAECKTLMLKLGERGMLTYRSNPSDTLDFRAFFVVDSFTDRVVDAVGSGDALLAYALLAMVTTKNAVIASVLGSMAAAVECERDGNIPVQPEDVRAKLDHVQKLISYGQG
jgi:rfaE bifunctional protein kinase chain/domain